ncbi:SigB/SigF/SigG family RNA polymerase sigma factor [Irregularibacter muris]|uniref:SigB/SigF/SigG family RNA polymerase sigma factor n=1 Tax=Irregularibacter muris TaxID=1796619 RepID=A0AAE3HJG9_9FIRM|nr:SigB/SigF/SigG family RNA polymerase sigma factor [Irregularibacter muris]MCR1899989.1 SigB/SigF/SigG family RNA polymerase sigma factor [Irregularibacter muris]
MTNDKKTKNRRQTLDDKKHMRELFKKYAETKDVHIRNELIERYIYIPEILSRKYVNKGTDYEDIFQVASMGLIFAIERFDLSRGFEFPSFATPTIIGEIKKYFRDKEWLIRVPRRIQNLSKKINVAKVDLQQQLLRTPTIEDIAKHLEITQEEVIEAMEGSYAYAPRSLDMTYRVHSDDKELSLIDMIGQADKNIEGIENKDFLDRAMDKLNEVEREVLKDRFFDLKTQSQIADKLGVSQMTVSRLEKKIIEKFKKELHK